MTKSNCPQLVNVDTEETFQVSRQRMTIGRSSNADVVVYAASCSREHAAVVEIDGCWHLEPLSSTAATFLNGKEIDSTEPIVNGALLEVGNTRFRFRAVPGKTRKTSAPSIKDHEGFTRIASVSDLGEIPTTESEYHLHDTVVIGRDLASAEIHLPHLHVSGRHAEISMDQEIATIRDMGSANGTFVNGDRIVGPTVINESDRIDIGPYSLVYKGNKLFPATRNNNAQLECRNVSHVVQDRMTRQPKTLLHEISLVIRPKEFVCLIGRAGCGKSTLLSAMSARMPASSGAVYLNEIDVYSNFESLKKDMALVPQRDVLHRDLSVEQALRFTAKLRLPPETEEREVDNVVSQTLRTVGLWEHRSTLIGNLSGGQARRASLASEILASPSLMFLDEVTSGLDEQTDREVMQLFRKLADAGKTIVCITHSLANVEQHCDKIVVLTEGGYLAFVGTPEETKEWFDVERLGDVYDVLNSKSADDWSTAFLASEVYQRNVASLLSPLRSTAFRQFKRAVFSWQECVTDSAQQCSLLLQRELVKKCADWKSLAVVGGQCLLVAALIVALFGNITENPDIDPLLTDTVNFTRCEGPDSAKIIFLMVVSCFWFGCNNAAKAIVSEKQIYTRERDVSLRISAYVATKFLFWSVVGSCQTLLLLSLVYCVCKLTGGYGGYLIMLLLSAMAGTGVGLAISAFAKTEDMAVTLVPVIVLPQIILAGCIAPLDGFVKLFSKLFATCTWAYNGTLEILPFHDHLPEPMQTDTTAFWGGAMLVLHLVVFLLATGAILDYQKGRDNLYELALEELSTRRTQVSRRLSDWLSDLVKKWRNRQNIVSVANELETN